MKSVKLRSVLLAILLAPGIVIAGDILDNIAFTLKTGNASELSKFFDTNIEITILDEEDVYSRAQAEVLIKNFFAKNPPTSFELMHQGSSKEGSKYGIGNLVTAKTTFRTYIYIKQKGKDYFIQELRFEEE